MSLFKLLITDVPHGKGEKLTRAAMESGAQGGTVLTGRALAKTNFGAVLGLGESSRDLILIVTDDEKSAAIIQGIEDASSNERRAFGGLYSVGVNSVLKTGNLKSAQSENQSEEKKMADAMEMITVIVNKGYADDVMAAARNAGAGGGTVINARGTAKETDQKFFGVHIVPEKEMLVMVVGSDKKDSVIKAVSELKCLKEPGLGIAYSSSITDFALLGKKSKK